MSSSNDDEKKLQVAVQNSIICQCKQSKLSIDRRRPIGQQLYFCKNCSDEMIFCLRCGPVLHTIYPHNWNDTSLISINRIVAQQANNNDLQVGRQKIMNFLGIIKWLKIAPLIEKIPTYVGNSVAGVTIYYEMNTAFNAALTGASYTTKNVAKFGGYGIMVASAVEMGYYVSKWMNKEIGAKDLCKLCTKCTIRNGASYLAMKGGMALGAMAGSAACLKFGAIGTAIAPGVGTVVGIVAGLICGLLAGMAADAIYDKCVSYDYETENRKRKEAIKEALLYFHFSQDDMKNPQKFNKKTLKKKFRIYALEAHPDRNDNEDAKWHELSAHYAVLEAILNQNQNNKKIIIKKTLSIQ